jgi:transcriptional regulator with XRE-family HTH domain
MHGLPKRGLSLVLRRERESKGLSRRDLAEASGLSYPYMSELEAGSKYPSERALENIAAALDMDAKELELHARQADQSALPVADVGGIGMSGNDAERRELEDRLVKQVISQIEPAIRNAIRVALGKDQ